LRDEAEELNGRPLDYDEAVKSLEGAIDAQRNTFEVPIGYLGSGDITGIKEILSFLDQNPTQGLLWLFPSEIKARIAKELKQHYKETDSVGITTESRNKRLKEIAAAVLNLEIAEEKLIQDGEAVGLEIDRRPDANPAVVLGVIEIGHP
jgi:hypothetical protein